MKDLLPDDRPREKLSRHGATALGDNELVALVIGTDPGTAARWRSPTRYWRLTAVCTGSRVPPATTSCGRPASGRRTRPASSRRWKWAGGR